MLSKIKLQPCPKCGRTPDIMETFVVMIGHVECDNLVVGFTRKEAVAEWNRRSTESEAAQ